MDREQAKRLGGHLRQARQRAEMTARDVADIAGVNDATVVRIENGSFANPHPETLAKIANALGLELAEVFAMADYAHPEGLPTLTPYLRAKYRNLPDDAITKIEHYATKLAAKHGVDLAGPAPGQDESP